MPDYDLVLDVLVPDLTKGPVGVLALEECPLWVEVDRTLQDLRGEGKLRSYFWTERARPDGVGAPEFGERFALRFHGEIDVHYRDGGSRDLFSELQTRLGDGINGRLTGPYVKLRMQEGGVADTVWLMDPRANQ